MKEKESQIKEQSKEQSSEGMKMEWDKEVSGGKKNHKKVK